MNIKHHQIADTYQTRMRDLASRIAAVRGLECRQSGAARSVMECPACAARRAFVISDVKAECNNCGLMYAAINTGAIGLGTALATGMNDGTLDSARDHARRFIEFANEHLPVNQPEVHSLVLLQTTDGSALAPTLDEAIAISGANPGDHCRYLKDTGTNRLVLQLALKSEAVKPNAAWTAIEVPS